ncbi:hypothetical protein ACFLYT_00745 [Nanoarchaeota archaeon]
MRIKKKVGISIIFLLVLFMFGCGTRVEVIRDSSVQTFSPTPAKIAAPVVKEPPKKVIVIDEAESVSVIEKQETQNPDEIKQYLLDKLKQEG